MRRRPSDGTSRFLLRVVVTLLVGVGAVLGGGGVVIAASVPGSQPASNADLPENTLAQEQPRICSRRADLLIGVFNANIERVPPFLRFTVRDTEIHGVFHNDTQRNYTFVTGPNGTIQSFDAGRPESPGLRMITDCETFTTISAANDPNAAFRSEYRNDEIRFVGVGFLNSIAISLFTLSPFVNRIVAEVLSHLPLLLLVLVLAFAYVGYRRYSVLSRGREGESGLRRTDAGESSPDEGDGGKTDGGDDQ